MGLLVTLTELLGRLTVVTPLLERYLMGNRAAAGAHQLQQSVSELNTAQSELSSTVESRLKEQQLRLTKIDETVARVANRLAEMGNEWEKLQADFDKLKGLLRLVLIVGLVSMVAALVVVTLLVLRVRY